MKEHKLYQKYYNLIQTHSDALSDISYTENFNSEATIQYCLTYYTKATEEVLYPGKSYVVALLYAHLLQKCFNEDFFESLRDPLLLSGNDKYFVPYSESSAPIYDSVLKIFPLHLREYTPPFHLPQVMKTKQYFELEFGILVQEYK